MPRVVLVFALLCSLVFAEEPAPTSNSAELLKAVAPTATGLFFESFHEPGWEQRWTVSKNPKYTGTWKVDEPANNVLPGDKSLILSDVARHHAIAARITPPVTMKDEDLVVQYEVKMQTVIDCGGAYMKLLQEGVDLEDFNGETPYVIMFGPDKCGHDNKVHFILRLENPLTKRFEEHHLSNPPQVKLDNLSHLYTLVVRKDNTFAVSIDGEVAREGSLLEDLTPPVNPPKTIPDPSDKKPADWVDNEMMDDPDVVKPADWDETAPMLIPDPTATKPADWDENAPEFVPDPTATKPAEWDEDVDGEWVAPNIPNPYCEEHHCGPWTRPEIRNPNYKGPWKAPQVKNPAFKGPWMPRQIPNPDYFENLHPHNMASISAVGFELWAMTAGVTFDNIYVGRDVMDARRLSDSSWKVRNTIESKIKTDAEKRAAEAARQASLKDAKTFTQKAQAYARIVGAQIAEHPLLVGTTAGAFVLTLIMMCCRARPRDDVVAPMGLDEPAEALAHSDEAEAEEEEKSEEEKEAGEEKEEEKPEEKEEKEPKEEKKQPEEKEEEKPEEKPEEKETPPEPAAAPAPSAEPAPELRKRATRKTRKAE